MCHGSLLSRPMTPLMARATTMVMGEAMTRSYACPVRLGKAKDGQ
jgi:hypothetical protein